MGCQINVADHDFENAGDLRVGPVHLLDVMNALVVVVDDLAGDCDFVRGLNFAEIGAVGFEREKAVVGRFNVIRAKAECCKHLVSGAVEQYAVIGHVEVTVVIDPLAFDGHGCGDMRLSFGHGGLFKVC